MTRRNSLPVHRQCLWLFLIPCGLVLHLIFVVSKTLPFIAPVTVEPNEPLLKEQQPSQQAPPVVQCTPQQLAKARQQLPPSKRCFEYPWYNKCSITLATKCPDSKNWLQEHYRTSFNADKFVGVNVGCNKGYDAIHMLRMGTGQVKVDKKHWKEALGPNVQPGVCQQENLPDLDLQGFASRSGEVHCIEPMPLTVRALVDAAKSTGMEDLGLKVTQAAVANGNGTVYFPSAPMGDEDWQQVKVGTENKGIQSCQDKPSEFCDPVTLVTLDNFVEEHLDNGRIHILTSDVEGFDFDVLLGGANTLERTEYVEFEYNWKGPWAKQQLKDAVDYMNDKRFTCYWAGIQKLWRLTSCWLDHYSTHNWSNVACVNRLLAPELAVRMESVFEETIDRED